MIISDEPVVIEMLRVDGFTSYLKLNVTDLGDMKGIGRSIKAPTKIILQGFNFINAMVFTFVMRILPTTDSGKYYSRFLRGQGDIFKLLGLSESQSKNPQKFSILSYETN